MRHDARDFVSRLIRKCSCKFAPLDETEKARAIWCTVSTAIISRAAQQLCRLLSADSPLGMPLQQLNLHPARTSSSTISTATLPHNMGNNHQQPSQVGPADVFLFDFEQEAASSNPQQPASSRGCAAVPNPATPAPASDRTASSTCNNPTMRLIVHSAGTSRSRLSSSSLPALPTCRR